MSGWQQTLRILSAACLAVGFVLVLSPVGWVAYTALSVGPTQTSALAAWEQGARGTAGPQAGATLPQDPGSALVLTIPRLGLRRLVPEGATPDNLRRFGVGRIAWTALPQAEGIVGIAGHRTTYGAPFFKLHTLRPGDTILVDYRGRRFTYEVLRSEVVTPDRVDLLEGLPGERSIGLVTCTPPYSATYRLVVLGTLRSVVPLTAVQ